LHHPFENVAMLWQEKIIRAQFFHGGVQRVIVQQDGAQDAALSLYIVREWTFDCYVTGSHGSIRFIFAYEREKRKHLRFF
jgi:hypothetical protein